MSYDDTGMYALQFFPILCKDENGVTIVVDDAIACEGKNAEDDGYNHTPIHCYCLDENMVWAQIMEKAYAKLHAGYDGFQGLGLHRVLAELTGMYCEDVPLSPAMKPWAWHRVLRAVADGDLVCLWKTSKVEENPIHSGMLPSRIFHVREDETGTRLVSHAPIGCASSREHSFEKIAKTFDFVLIAHGATSRAGMKIDGSNRCFRSGWKEMRHVYPVSPSMDMLSMPCLTLRSESSISVLIRVVTQKEASLTIVRAEDLVDFIIGGRAVNSSGLPRNVDGDSGAASLVHLGP